MRLAEIASEIKAQGFEEDVASVLIVNERNRLLSECDWTQMPDAQLTDLQREEWLTYRQELRDITKRDDFPFLLSSPLPPKTKVWIAERTRSPEVEEEMRLEREALEAKAREMQAEYERSLQPEGL